MPLVLLAVSVTAGMLLRSVGGRVALVEDHDPDGAGRRGVLGLELERAGATLQQRDVPGREAREVGSLAPAGRGVAQAELQVDGRDRRGDVAGVGLGDRPEVDALDIGDRVRCDLLEGRGADDLEREVVERLHLRVVAGGLERLDHVVDRGVVAREAGEAVSVVLVGDRLERRLVLAHPARPGRTRAACRTCCSSAFVAARLRRPPIRDTWPAGALCDHTHRVAAVTAATRSPGDSPIGG